MSLRRFLARVVVGTHVPQPFAIERAPSMGGAVVHGTAGLCFVDVVELLRLLCLAYSSGHLLAQLLLYGSHLIVHTVRCPCTDAVETYWYVNSRPLLVQ